MNRYPNSDEIWLLRQLFSPNGDYLAVVVLVGLFVALLFRRDLIRSVAMFRLGYISFIISIFGPTLLQSWWSAIAPGVVFADRRSETPVLYAGITSVGPIFLAIALMCILGSLLPPSGVRSRATPPPVPQKHPLD